MGVSRLERSALGRLRGMGGYVLNVHPSEARLHLASCTLVARMNPGKRRGIYHAATLEEALEWVEAEAIVGVPCGLCLPRLAHGPRPEKLAGILPRGDAPEDVPSRL